MNSYIYRDARIERLTSTLADMDIFVAVDPSVHPALVAELAALQTDDWTVTDRTYEMIGADFISSASLDWPVLVSLVAGDPALAAFGQAPAFTEPQAQAISQLHEPPGAPRPDYLDRVRAAIGGDETVLAELLHAGHRRWLALPAADRPYPYDDVGVLLPLRLETLFDAPDTTHNPHLTRWQLLLRVTPDEASIRRDDTFVSNGEQAALLAFWQAVRQPGDPNETWLDGDEAGIAWRQLADRVRPERAAWLVGEVPVRLDGDDLRLELPADMPAGPQPNRAGGLPPELHVFAVTTAAGGGGQHLIGRLPMDENTRIRNEELALHLPQSLDEERNRWWASWEQAKAVGLGGEWLLPDGLTPDTIDALYVVGISDETPEAHFRGQVDAGEFSLMRLGVPTNHVGPGAASGPDAAVWLKVARERLTEQFFPQPLPFTGIKIQSSLLGRSAKLPFFPGADAADEIHDSRLMAIALWPALWGHWLHDLWQQGNDAYRVGAWMFENFQPEGPFPPLRIGDQPYGLLPVTALSRWQPDQDDMAAAAGLGALELPMARKLAETRDEWAAVVRNKNSVVGRPTADFMRLLGRDALSRGYLERRFLPAWAAIAFSAWNGDEINRFNNRLLEDYRAAIDLFGREPDPLYLANGSPRPVRLPLVQPTRMIARENGDRLPLREFLDLLFNWDPHNPDDLDLRLMFMEHVLDALPDSLLLRLLFYACQMIVSWRRDPDGSPPEQRVWDGQAAAAFRIGSWFDDPAWLSERVNPFQPDPLSRHHILPTVTIPEERLRGLERALRATLDSAAHRIDPWITGFAWQRLRRNTDSWRGAHRLGAYGWLDGPFEGLPGPTDAGRLHTPSYNQTIAALVLRDKYLSSGRAGLVNELGDDLWHMDITSGKARLAEELADEVRMGFHIHEILGRRVENIIGAHQKVKELRTSDQYAMFPERKDPHEVCNGEAALRGLLQPGGDPAFPLTAGQELALRHLSAALDTYGDLLLADGVMQLVNREIDRAATTMDAAAGFTRPPSFDFLRTPPSGYQLESVVVSVLPFVNVDSLDPSATPGRLADPSIAAFLEAQLGNDWTWSAINEDEDDQPVIGAVSLAELGLGAAPIDTLALSTEFLNDMARLKLGLPLVTIGEERNRLWSATDENGVALGRITLADLPLLPAEVAALETAELHNRVRQALGLADDAFVTEGIPDDPRLWVATDERGKLLGKIVPGAPGLSAGEIAAAEAKGELHKLIRQALGRPSVRLVEAREHELARQLAAALGSRPAAGRDLLENSPLVDDPAARAALELGVYTDLHNRYVKLYTAAGDMIDRLRAAVDDDARVAALRQALAWGLTPLAEPVDRDGLLAALLGLDPPDGATSLAELAEKAAAALADRREAAVDPVELLAPAAIGEPQPDLAPAYLPDGVSSLARSIAGLASADGKQAVLARWPRDEIVTCLTLDTTQIAPDLDEAWLTVVAAPRAALARLEALQLELAQPLTGWSSSPHDPWQTDQVADNLLKRQEGITEIQMPRFAAAYGPAETWGGAEVAVGLVDAFSEAIPMPERITMTAFGFNAPAARAPQAILLAVPPVSRRRLDADMLRQIVAETRALAHARTVRLEDIEPAALNQAQAPSMWLGTDGPLRIRLRPYPLTGNF